jgi:hypothetical protein
MMAFPIDNATFFEVFQPWLHLAILLCIPLLTIYPFFLDESIQTNSTNKTPQVEAKVGGSMNHRKLFATALFLMTAFSISVLSVWADEFNQQTKITFSEPVEIPGQTLPAGTYWFVLADSNSGRNIVRIFSADRSVLYATLFTAPSERAEIKYDTTLTFAERPSSKPEAILTWFYPGLTTGHEFLYPENEERELAHDALQNIVAGSSGFAGGH